MSGEAIERLGIALLVVGVISLSLAGLIVSTAVGLATFGLLAFVIGWRFVVLANRGVGS